MAKRKYNTACIDKKSKNVPDLSSVKLPYYCENCGESYYNKRRCTRCKSYAVIKVKEYRDYANEVRNSPLTKACAGAI